MDRKQEIKELICKLAITQERLEIISQEKCHLEQELKKLECRIEELEKEKEDEERILETFTESKVIGRRKDGSRIFGKPRKMKE